MVVGGIWEALQKQGYVNMVLEVIFLSGSSHTVEPPYNGQLGTNAQCPLFGGVRCIEVSYCFAYFEPLFDLKLIIVTSSNKYGYIVLIVFKNNLCKPGIKK